MIHVSTNPTTEAHEHLEWSLSQLAPIVGALTLETEQDDFPIDRDTVRRACRELAAVRGALQAALSSLNPAAKS